MNKRYPRYPDDADYQTNAPSYYEDLARKNKLIKELAKRIWEYDKKLDTSLKNIENVLNEYVNIIDGKIELIDNKIGEGFNQEINDLLVKWLNDGTLDHIINETLMNKKADKDYVDSEFNDVNTRINHSELKNSLVDTLDFSLEFTIDPTKWDIGYGNVIPRDFQSMVVTDEKIYLTGSQKPSTEPTGVLFEINKRTLELERFLFSDFYHSNGMTYCKDYKGKEVLIITHLWNSQNNMDNKLSIIDIETLKLMEIVELNHNSRTVAYDEEKDIFISATDNERIHYDKQFNEIKRFNVDRLGTSQANYIHGEYHIMPFTSPHLIVVEDLEGRVLKQYYIPTKLVPEVEAVSFIDNKEKDSLLLLTNTGFGQPIKFYRVRLFKTTTGYYDYSKIVYRKTLGDKMISDYVYVDSAYKGEPNGSENFPYRSIDEALRSVNYEGNITIDIKSGVYDEDVVIEGFNGLLRLQATGGTVSLRTMYCRDISGDFQIHGNFLFYGSKPMEGTTTTALAFRAVNSFHIYSKLSFIGEEKGNYVFKLFHSKGSIVNGYESNNFTFGILVGNNSHVYLTGNVSHNSERESLISENGSIVSVPIESGYSTSVNNGTILEV